MDREPWWATVCKVKKSQIRLKLFSTSGKAVKKKKKKKNTKNSNLTFILQTNKKCYWLKMD